MHSDIYQDLNVVGIYISGIQNYMKSFLNNRISPKLFIPTLEFLNVYDIYIYTNLDCAVWKT